MENPNEPNVEKWIDEQLAGLNPPAEYRPDSEAALIRLRALDRRTAVERQAIRLIFSFLLTAAAVLIIFPSARAMALNLCYGIFMRAPETTEMPSASDFELENVAGGVTRAAELQGKVSVIDFWATWCVPCITEIPAFNELHTAYQGKDVRVVAITVESPYVSIADKVKEYGMKYPVLVGNEDVVGGFGGLLGFPTTFVVTKDWKIYKKYLGVLPDKHERIKKDIEDLLAAGQ